MGGEGIGQAQRGGELSAVEAGPENPEWHIFTRAGRCLKAEPSITRKIGLQFQHVARKFIRPTGKRAAHGLSHPLVRSGRAA